MKTLNQFLDESTGGGVPLTPQELEIQKKMSRLNVRLARKRSQEMQKAKVKDTETAPEQVKEAKVEAGRSDYGKASVRNKRKFGKEGEPAVFDASGERGKMIDKRRAEHKAKRGVKEQMEKDNGVDDQQQKQIDAKQKKADQIKKQVLLKKLQAVRQGGGSEIMASYSWRDDKNMRINKILNS